MNKILIVDDEKSIRGFIKNIVKTLNYDSLEAENGEEALEIYKNEQVDLCIVDVRMPKLNGLEFLKKVKKFDSNAIVIIMSAYPSAENIIKMIEEDGYTYITKPIDVNKIIDLINSGLKVRKEKLKVQKQ